MRLSKIKIKMKKIVNQISTVSFNILKTMNFQMNTTKKMKTLKSKNLQEKQFKKKG